MHNVYLIQNLQSLSWNGYLILIQNLQSLSWNRYLILTQNLQSVSLTTTLFSLFYKCCWLVPIHKVWRQFIDSRSFSSSFAKLFLVGLESFMRLQQWFQVWMFDLVSWQKKVWKLSSLWTQIYESENNVSLIGGGGGEYFLPMSLTSDLWHVLNYRSL